MLIVRGQRGKVCISWKRAKPGKRVVLVGHGHEREGV